MTTIVLTVLARWLMIVACWCLPRRQRLRYRAEFVADLAALDSGPERVGYSWSLVWAAPRLRRALVSARAPLPLACRLRRHAWQRFRPNPENHTVVALVCRRCEAVRDPKQYDAKGDAHGAAYGSVFMSGGMGG